MGQLEKALKKKAVGVYLVLGFVLFLVGSFFLLISLVDFIDYMATDLNIWDYSAYSMQEDNWYICDNNYLLGCYAYNDDGLCYVTATKDDHYIGYYVPNKYGELADQISEECWAYLEGTAEDWPERFVRGRGRIEDMDADQREFFREWFEDAGADQDTMSSLLYYTVYLVSPWEVLFGDGNAFLLIVGLVPFITGLTFLILYITRSYKRRLHKLMVEKGISEQALDYDMASAVCVQDLWIGSRYIVHASVSPKLFAGDQLVWVYNQVTTTRYRAYGIIPMGSSKSYALTLIDRANKLFSVPFSKEERAQAALQAVHEKMPYLFCGYSEDLNRVRAADFQSMVNRVEEEKLRPAGIVEAGQTEQGN